MESPSEFARMFEHGEGFFDRLNADEFQNEQFDSSCVYIDFFMNTYENETKEESIKRPSVDGFDDNASTQLAIS